MRRHLSTSGLLISTRVYFDHFGLAFVAFLKTSSYTRNKSFAVLSLPAENSRFRRTDGRTDGRTHPLIESWLTTKNDMSRFFPKNTTVEATFLYLCRASNQYCTEGDETWRRNKVNLHQLDSNF